MSEWQLSIESWEEKTPPFLPKRPEKNSSIPLGYYGGADTKLDIHKKYEFRDRSENFWRFTFESIAGEEGWFAWVRRANSEEYFCVGKIPEPQLIEKLTSNPNPLTEDDYIDLELWMKRSGFIEYPKRRSGGSRRRKQS